MEDTDLLVVPCHRPFTLENPDLDRRLVIRSCREHFGLAGRDGGIGLDELCHDTAEGLDTE